MGDPKKARKKYSTPIHPWVKSTIEEERLITREYGTKTKTEIFKARSFLKKYKDLAKTLIAEKTAQGEKEKQQIIEKLQRLGLLTPGSGLDDILNLQLKDVLERRLQSIVFRKGLARSMNQARQFITHRHIILGEKEITSPAYLVTLEEESKLSFKERSTLASEDHPERVIIKEKPVPSAPREVIKDEKAEELAEETGEGLELDESQEELEEELNTKEEKGTEE